MAKIHAEAAASPAEKALWRSVLDRLSAAAAVVALVVLAVHTGAHEAAVVAFSPLVMTDPLYIMRSGLLTLLCGLAAYHCWSLHRKRTGR
ncbi:DUF3693 domain-containing protein [Xanthomonas campestris pv. campestris]|nr:DUF3693 domain-containing protein [Xanthomonas campestris]MEA0857811.1 DUF3693 domain-containing protein [Xanthomonas campestris pv. campestris]MEB1432854.1 DUF3693 domain-containing protein [Xanthomonas campestris pv. campestris]